MTAKTGSTALGWHRHTWCIAFCGTQRIGAGELKDVVLKAKSVFDQQTMAPILLFNELSSEPIEVDFRGAPEDVKNRLPEPPPESASEMTSERGPGRPKLGVVGREVTLLPRHWEWLNRQPGGASVALRKLVEEARHASAGKDRLREAQEGCYRFLSVMAGNLPGFEDATRALYSGNQAQYAELITAWPEDIRQHAATLASRVFEATSR